MLTYEEILQVAMRQSARDFCCSAEDFLKAEPVLTDFRRNADIKIYYKDPVSCNFISYGNNIVATAAAPFRETVRSYITKYTFWECFETPAVHRLDDALAPSGHKVCFLAEYYLPDPRKLTGHTCRCSTRLLYPEDFAGFYLPEWSNALCKSRKEADVLAVGAYDGDTLVGLAGCSADCGDMRQIGVDVLPAYRRRGIAAALTSELAREILRRDLVPFYCTAWSNLPSMRNALTCGFVPAWVEMAVKPLSVIEKLNG